MAITYHRIRSTAGFFSYGGVDDLLKSLMVFCLLREEWHTGIHGLERINTDQICENPSHLYSSVCYFCYPKWEKISITYRQNKPLLCKVYRR